MWPFIRRKRPISMTDIAICLVAAVENEGKNGRAEITIEGQETYETNAGKWRPTGDWKITIERVRQP